MFVASLPIIVFVRPTNVHALQNLIYGNSSMDVVCTTEPPCSVEVHTCLPWWRTPPTSFGYVG